MSVSLSGRSSTRNTTPPRGNPVVGTNPRGGQYPAIIFAAHQRTPTTSPGTTPKDSSLGILGGGLGQPQPFSSLHCGPPPGLHQQQQQYTTDTDMIFGDVPISNNLTTGQRNQQQQHAPHSSRVQPLLNHSPALSTFLEEFHKLKDSLFDLSLSQGNEEEEKNDCSIAPSGQEKSIRNLITRLRKLHLEDAQQYLEVLLNLCEKFSTAIACPPTPEKDAFGGEEAPAIHLSASGTKTGTTFSSTSQHSYPPTPAVLPHQPGNYSSAQLLLSGRASLSAASSFNLFVSPSVGLNLGDALLPPNKTSELPSNASSASLSTFQPTVLTTKVVNNDSSELSGEGGPATDALSELNQYTLLREVGSGSQGTVYLGFDNKAGEFRAVKEIRRGLPGSAVNLKLKDEVRIMKRLRHENIVTLHEILDDPRAKHLYLVMQYVEKGPVVQWIEIGEGRCEMIDPWRLQYFSRQVTAGLMYLHERRIYHQDIKPDNILLGTDDRVFLADFGVAQSLQFDASSLRDLCNTSFTPCSGTDSSPALGVGTPAYFAPELLEAIALEKTIEDLDRSAVDIWALGVSFYQLLSGRLPFAIVAKTHQEPEPAPQDDGDVAPLPSSYASPLINVNRSSSEELMMNPPPLSSSCSTAYFPDDDDDDRGLREKVDDDEHEGGQSSNSISAEEPTDDSDYRLVKLKERFPSGWHCYLSSVLHDSIQMSDDFKSNFFIPPEWKSLLKGMLQKDPSKRWSLTEVRQEIKSMGRHYEDDETRLALGGSTTMKISEDGVSTSTTSKGRRKKLQDEVAQAHLNV